MRATPLTLGYVIVPNEALSLSLSLSRSRSRALLARARPLSLRSLSPSLSLSLCLSLSVQQAGRDVERLEHRLNSTNSILLRLERNPELAATTPGRLQHGEDGHMCVVALKTSCP
jgi:hypothetical protein